MPLGIKVGSHPCYFARIFLVAAALETWGKAHLHLGIDAAGKGGIGVQILHAAPHLEEIERIVHKLLGGGAGNKWTVVKRTTIKASQSDCDRGAHTDCRDVALTA